MEPIETMSVTSGFPCVSVPVLSKITAEILLAASNASPPFTSTPYSAPLPVPTISDVGVASPSAHGHAITITDVNAISENASVAPRAKYHTPNVKIAIPITAGTNHAEILSAKF
ncbi:MAG: hypothetical protein ACD_67C00162G0002 [uncultured bacterium]|nr:MAG: hypothetical protein ACD_67C00162G0002 [uncultured bacterium]